MSRLLRRTLLAAAMAFVAEASPPTLAQTKPDAKKATTDSKTALKYLFSKAVAKPAEATVRVRSDDKNVALGTILDDSGFILTKGSELRSKIAVLLSNGDEYDAEYIGYHEPSDLALLKIDAKKLTAIAFVDGKEAAAGNMVAAPNPDGLSVAAGIVSAGVRKLYREEAVISNGNKGYLGIHVDQKRKDDGAFIEEFSDTRNPLSPPSPARRAKLLVGDQIAMINDQTITNADDLLGMLDKYKPGDKIKVLVRRKIKDSDETDELQIEVRLGNSGDRGDMQNKMGSALSDRRTGFPQVITTDLVIEPRDCGGPLVDIDGRVLGITIARAGRVESWVLPKEVIQPIYAELKAGKHPKK